MIKVDGDELNYKAYISIGELYGEATITKNFKGGEKSITQKRPDSELRTLDNTHKTKDSHGLKVVKPADIK